MERETSSGQSATAGPSGDTSEELVEGAEPAADHGAWPPEAVASASFRRTLHPILRITCIHQPIPASIHHKSFNVWSGHDNANLCCAEGYDEGSLWGGSCGVGAKCGLEPYNVRSNL